MGQFRQHQPQEIQRHHRVQFALAVQPCAERVWNFHGAQPAAGGRDDIEQDLEALGRKLRGQLFEAVAPDHEEAAHRVGDLDPQQPFCHPGGQRAGAGPLPVEAVGAAAFDIAAADHELGRAGLQQLKHLRQLGLVVLQVGVDHGGAGRAGRQDTLDTGAGQAAASDPPDTANAAILPREIAHHLPGAVGRIVIDKDDFPGDARERSFQPPQQRGDIITLIEGRDDDRELRRTAGLQRDFGARSDGFIHAAAYIRRLRRCQGAASGPQTRAFGHPPATVSRI